MEYIIRKMDEMKNDLLRSHADNECWATWFNMQAAESVQQHDETERKRLKSEFDFMARARIMGHSFGHPSVFVKTDDLSGSLKEQYDRFVLSPSGDNACEHSSTNVLSPSEVIFAEQQKNIDEAFIEASKNFEGSHWKMDESGKMKQIHPAKVQK